MKSSRELSADFDRIAGVLQNTRDAGPTATQQRLLAHVPPDARTALDVGCGEGVIARAIAARGLQVTAIDLSPQMLALAKQRTPTTASITYTQADFTDEKLQLGTFDVVTCFAVLHHLPLASGIERLIQFVRPGGSLLIQDIVTRPGLRYLPINLVARVAGVSAHIRRLGLKTMLDLRRAYEAHGRDEEYLTPDAVATEFSRLLPGATIEQHIDWRYSVVWKRPASR